MDERIGIISHNGKQILAVDLSNCSAAEVEKTVRALPEVVDPPKPDFMIGCVIKESRLVQVRAHGEAVNLPGSDAGLYLESIKS